MKINAKNLPKKEEDLQQFWWIIFLEKILKF